MKLEDLTLEQQEKISEFGLNTWYVLELLGEYKKNPDSVSDNWKTLFNELNLTTNGNKTLATQKVQASTTNGQSQLQQQINMPLPVEGEEAQIIKGVGAKIIENMTSSLTIPTATSFRTIPVKVLEENRIIINNFLKKNNQGKISFTHIIGWAIVKAIASIPQMNNSFTVIDGVPHLVKKPSVNLGLAVD